MSVEMAPSVEVIADAQDVCAFAASTSVDARLPQLVAGFDAPFFQAGLAGYSDAAMRLVARRHGCPFCVTEALLDLTLINGGKGRRREDPDLLAQECGLGDPGENRLGGLDDHPVAGQVMGTETATMAQGAAILVGMGYDVIDVNLACPVKKIRRRRRGGHFLAAPGEAIAVLQAVRSAVPAEIPTTLKMRRGFDDEPGSSDDALRILDAAMDAGYAWATVHARTVVQKYKGPSSWPALSELVASRPDAIILGSGDIWTAADVFRMLERTGVQGVSIARGCIGNPWIFRQARQLMAGEDPTLPSIAEQRDALLTHFELSAALHGEQGASRMMRKFGIRFAHHHEDGETVRRRFISVSSTADWKAVLEEYYGY